MKKLTIILFTLLISCTNNDDDSTTIPVENLYFPPLTGTLWETKTLNSLGWNENNIEPLLDYLEEKNTKGFIVLHKGKIVIEEYFNNHTVDSNWYWASAGKTLTSLTVGIAQEEGYLSISDKTSDYLGTNWTSLSSEKEELVKIKNQLSMTTGFNDNEFDCLTANCLTYLADAGTRWSYHNGPYTLLDGVVTNAVGQEFEDYFYEKIRDKVGMNGIWYFNNNNNVYFSTTRSMARFGLLISNDAKWDQTTILNDTNYFTEMTNTSQNINQSYGYLWWLNGKGTYHLPQSQLEFNGSLIPNAPDDMIMALGKNDQKIYVIPSKDLIVIRMGESADNENFTISSFDNDLWEKINLVIN